MENRLIDECPAAKVSCIFRTEQAQQYINVIQTRESGELGHPVRQYVFCQTEYIIGRCDTYSYGTTVRVLLGYIYYWSVWYILMWYDCTCFVRLYILLVRVIHTHMLRLYVFCKAIYIYCSSVWCIRYDRVLSHFIAGLGFGLWWLTPLSTIFQLYRDG